MVSGCVGASAAKWPDGQQHQALSDGDDEGRRAAPRRMRISLAAAAAAATTVVDAKVNACLRLYADPVVDLASASASAGDGLIVLSRTGQVRISSAPYLIERLASASPSDALHCSGGPLGSRCRTGCPAPSRGGA